MRTICYVRRSSMIRIFLEGCCSAVLCKQNDQGDYQCQPLSVNHDLSNPQELQRLIKLGLDVEKLRQIGKIGRFNYTRTLGDYYVKGGYKDIQIIRCVIKYSFLSVFIDIKY